MTIKIQLKNYIKEIIITNILKFITLCTIFVNFCECIFISEIKMYTMSLSLTNDIL